MTVLELIKELKKVLGKHGNLDVEVLDCAGESDLANEVEIRTYCLGTDQERTVVEIRH